MLEVPLSLVPNGIGPGIHVAPLAGQHYLFPATVRLACNDRGEPVTLQRTQVVTQGRPIHDHRVCEFSHRQRLIAMTFDFAKDRELGRFESIRR